VYAVLCVVGMGRLMRMRMSGRKWIVRIGGMRFWILGLLSDYQPSLLESFPSSPDFALITIPSPRSLSSARLRSSTTIPHLHSLLPVSPTSLECRHTFFCNRITDVHFFSSNPTHFAFPSLGSKSSVSVSRRKDSYVSCRPEACR